MAHWKNNPDHGWLYLTQEELQAIPECARLPQYEEDCSWSLAYVGLESVGRMNVIEQLEGEKNKVEQAQVMSLAHSTCKNWYPHEYTKITGKLVAPEESHTLREEIFRDAFKDKWVVFCASGDWKAGVPVGYVEGIARLGAHPASDDHAGYEVWRKSEEKTFFIPKKRYDKRGEFGYVVQGSDLEKSEGDEVQDAT